MPDKISVDDSIKKKINPYAGLLTWEGVMSNTQPQNPSLSSNQGVPPPNGQRMASGYISPSGMPVQNPVPSQQQMTPANQAPMQGGGVSNLVNQSPMVQPAQLQGINPYAGMGYGSINPEGFKREQAALNTQGRVMEQGQAQLGKQTSELAGNQASAMQGLQKQSSKAMEDYKAQSKDFDTRINDVQKRFPALSREQVIDSYDAGKKAVLGLSVLFGGIGAAMTGGKNMALEVINSNIDSVIDSNRKNFTQTMDVLNSKRAKSAQDYDFARQQLQDSTTLQNNVFNAMQTKIDAEYKKNIAPAARAQLEAASAQVAQRQAAANQQTAVQNLQLQLQGRQWQAQMAMNPRAVTIGTDAKGKPIQAVSASDKSAEVLREQIPQIDQKIQAVKDLINYVSTAPNSQGRDQTFIGKNLEGMKQQIGKLYGLDPKDIPDITQTVGRDATDFYNNLLTQATQQKQNIINANTLH